MGATHASVHGEFDRARQQILGANLRSEMQWQQIESPDRVAQRSLALAGAISGAGAREPMDSAAGVGRFILLYDPSSTDEWGGNFRIVCYAQAPLELDISLDPFIGEVTWSWLTDALSALGAEYSHIAGTATKNISEGFGQLASGQQGAQLELRASWSPEGENFAAHVQSWAEVLCSLAGFPPREGATSLQAFKHTRQR